MVKRMRQCEGEKVKRVSVQPYVLAQARSIQRGESVKEIPHE